LDFFDFFGFFGFLDSKMDPLVDGIWIQNKNLKDRLGGFGIKKSQHTTNYA
jgi:hypothetical protein